MNQSVMEKLLHDSFANYVVQTSLDFAEEDQRAEVKRHKIIHVFNRLTW